MAMTTVRILEEKRDILKIIASIEKRKIKETVTELIDEYVDRHRETLDLLSKPEWVSAIRAGKTEVLKSVKGKSLSELDD